MEKNLIRNFIIYSLPNILTQTLPFFVLPITTRFLTINDFGYLALFFILLLPFKAVMQFGASYVISSTWFKIDINLKKELIFLLLMISIILAFITIIFISIFYEYIFPFIAGDSWNGLKELYWLLVIYVIAIIPEEIFLSWSVIERKVVLNSSVLLSKIFISTAVVVILAVLTRNYKLILIGRVASESLIYIYLYYCLFKASKINFNKKLLKRIFVISYPTFFQLFFTSLRIQFDKLYINKLFGTTQLALYNFSDRFNVTFLSISRNYERSYSPALYQQLANDNIQIKKLRATLMFWFVIAYFFSISVVILGRWFISVFTNNVYNDTYQYVILYLTILLFPLLFMADIMILIHFHKTKYIMLSSLIESIIAVVSCIILIPIFGITGAIISIWLGKFIYYLLFFIKRRKLINMSIIEYIVLPYVIFFHLAVLSKVYIKFKHIDILLVISFIILLIDFFVRNKNFILSYINSIFKKNKKV